jgi:methylated-DNA-[protein]-cysteine S-methyltransferase
MPAALIPSPVGPLYVAVEEGFVTELYTNGSGARPAHDDPAFAPVKVQLDEYFDGSRTSFDLPLKPKGTPFMQRVYAALQAIPYGETRTYGDLARELGSGPRAVGRANGLNPISIIVPCHRLIGANGSLTGYGGGLEIKRALLDHEQSSYAARRASWPPRS